MVAFPEVQIEQLLIWNPFQPAFRGVDQLTGKHTGRKDKDIPIIAFELGEHQQPAIFRISDGQSRLFEYFADHTFLGRFPGFELSAQAVPFSSMNVIGFLIAMNQT